MQCTIHYEQYSRIGLLLGLEVHGRSVPLVLHDRIKHFTLLTLGAVSVAVQNLFLTTAYERRGALCVEDSCVKLWEAPSLLRLTGIFLAEMKSLPLEAQKLRALISGVVTMP